MKQLAVVLIFLFTAFSAAVSQDKPVWRAASSAELEAGLPARAPVAREHIETEMRTATGIVNDRGQLIAAVVLITAGYSADGKYSHYLLAQAPIKIDNRLDLSPGNYVIGWKRGEDGLLVHFFDAVSGMEKGAVLAKAPREGGRVESFHIWPPSDRPVIQIGRFLLPYSIGR